MSWVSNPSSVNLTTTQIGMLTVTTLAVTGNSALSTTQVAGLLTTSLGLTASGTVNTSLNTTQVGALTSTGAIADLVGNIRTVPQSGSDKVTSYTLQKSDVGQFIGIGASGSATVPDAVFADGDIVSLVNNTTGSITITGSITTMYLAGTDADKATLSLATRGVATILFLSGTVCEVSGNVS